MKHIEIIVDLSQVMSRGQMATMEIGRTMARETMGIARKTGWLYYGRLDLSESEWWKYEILREDGTTEADGSTETTGGVGQIPGHAINLLTLPPHIASVIAPHYHHTNNAVQNHHPNWNQQIHTAQPYPAPTKWLVSAWLDH